MPQCRDSICLQLTTLWIAQPLTWTQCRNPSTTTWSTTACVLKKPWAWVNLALIYKTCWCWALELFLTCNLLQWSRSRSQSRVKTLKEKENNFKANLNIWKIKLSHTIVLKPEHNKRENKRLVALYLDSLLSFVPNSHSHNGVLISLTLGILSSQFHAYSQCQMQRSLTCSGAWPASHGTFMDSSNILRPKPCKKKF